MQYKSDGKSIYFYANSSVLINKSDVHDQKILTSIESGYHP